MEFSIKLDTVKSGWSIIYGLTGYNFQNIEYNSLKIDFVFANITDPDEMLHYAAFHLSLHCLRKYLSWDLQSTNG